jgi:chaperonin cofactor prefoldin
MRMISIILTELAKDKLVAEEQLQRLINDKSDVNENISNIKEILREIVLIDEMIIKWKSYTTNEDDNSSNNNN